jgi:hypothetical protein
MKGQIQILPLFLAIVHLSRVNLSAVGKRPAPHPGGKLQQTPPDGRQTQSGGVARRVAERLIRRRPGLWKWHQDDGHRNPADLAAAVDQRAASQSEPGGRLPPCLRPNAQPLAAGLPEQLDRQVWGGVGDNVPERPRDANPLEPKRLPIICISI